MKVDLTQKEIRAKEICDDIKFVCSQFGTREAGGEGERRVAEYMSEQLSSCAENVRVESFKVYPNAFMGWIYISSTCMLLAYAAYFFSCMVSVLLSICAIIPFVFQFVLHKRFFDPLYGEKTSSNVTAIKPCGGERKKGIYLVANIDASHEWTLNYKFGGTAAFAIILSFVLGIIYVVAISVARWILVGELGARIAQSSMLYAGAAGGIFLPSFFAMYFIINTKRVVSGANENLSGCEIALKVVQSLKDVQYENCEVGVILTGSGMVGLRGAKAWCDAHSSEFDKDNSVFICLNTLREDECICANTKDLNGLVKSDGDVVNMLVEGAKVSGVHCEKGVRLGASDSAVFTQNGFKSATLTAVEKKPAYYLHTRYDNPDNISEKCISECFATVMMTIENYANEG